MDRDGYSCQVYEYGFPTTQRCQGRVILHHRKPKGMGGTFDPEIHSMENLVALCDGHHVEVHHRPALSYECSLLIRR
jgi:hypothetical protein